MNINDILIFLETLRDNLTNFDLDELEDIANASQDICDDIDKLLQ